MNIFSLKRSLILLTFISISFGVAGQKFSYSPAKTRTEYIENKDEVIVEITMKNTTSDSLLCRYKVIENTFDSRQSAGMCMPGTCFLNIPAQGDFFLGSVFQKEGVFSAHVYECQKYKVGGKLVLQVFEISNPSVVDTLTFIIGITAGVQDFNQGKNVSVLRNIIVHNEIKIPSELRNSIKKYEISNMNGNVVNTTSFGNSMQNIPISNLTNGTYVLRYYGLSGQFITQTFIKQ